MLKTVIGGLLCVLAGALLMALLAKLPTYILISVGDTDVEMTLWVLVFFLVLLALSLWLLWRWVLRPMRASATALREQRRRRAAQLSREGLLHFIHGEWAAARQKLLSASSSSEHAELNYLAAIGCALAEDAKDTARNILIDAEKHLPASPALRLARARQLLIEGDAEEALNLARALPDTARSLRLRHDALAALKRWDEAIALVPALKKHKLVSEAEELRLYQGHLAALATGEQALRALEHAWQALPKEIKRLPPLVGHYSSQLHALGADAQAANLIQASLKQQWHGPLAELYGELDAPAAEQALKTAESWLKHHPDDAHLLFALGRLSAKCALWGKARDYFETSLRLDPRPRTYAALGLLLAQMGDAEGSHTLFRRGLLASEQCGTANLRAAAVS